MWTCACNLGPVFLLTWHLSKHCLRLDLTIAAARKENLRSRRGVDNGVRRAVDEYVAKLGDEKESLEADLAEHLRFIHDLEVSGVVGSCLSRP